MEYIFVYGVFRDVNSSLLEDSIYCDDGFIYGELYQVNEFYPGFIRSDCYKKCIHNCDLCRVFGKIYLIDKNILPKLDEFEGDEYERKKIWTSIGVEAWIYEYKYDVSKFKRIKNGDWILR